MNSEKKTRTRCLGRFRGFRIPPELDERLFEFATITGLTMSRVVIEGIELALEKNKPMLDFRRNAS